MTDERLNREAFLARIAQLNIFQRGGERAPHKPLLLLLALARMDRGEARLIPFREVREPLRRLLEGFGPPRRTQHPEYPFWRLENDGIWTVEWPPPLRVRERGRDPSARELVDHDVRAGLSPEAFELLRDDPHLRQRTARALLEAHFPHSLHEEILTSVGLDLEEESAGAPPRDPRFRDRVLVAYEYRCAICGFDLRLDTTPVGLDAAHIRWKQAGGPDRETNGLALCAVHHRLFDRGAFTVQPQLRIVVSQRAVGGESVRDWLLRFHGEILQGPQAPAQRPNPKHLGWHHKQVFREPARVIGD